MKDINDLREMLKKDNLPTFPSRLFTVEEAADALDVSPQSVRNWEKSGVLIPQRTAGGHRRYTQEQINGLKKKRMTDQEIILPNLTPARLLEMTSNFLSFFEQNKPVTVSIRTNQFERNVKIAVDSEDNLTTMVKTFNIEE